MKYLFFSYLLLLLTLNLYSANRSTDNLVKRISGNTADNIVTCIKKGEKEFFEISGKGKKVKITGNSPVSVATGLNWYLKYNAGIHISWNNLTREFPDKLPVPATTIRKETDTRHRYYLNYCTFSYSMAFWDWERWEKEIDWMALHGINLVLDIIGNDVVWYNLLKRIGYSEDEINRFIAGPAFQAWWQMNNLEGWGGPNTEEWYTRQHELQIKILARFRELGIEPVFPGYAGMVPRDIGEKLGYKITNPGLWCGFNRPAFLSPTDPHFDEFADMYYQEMEKLYGKANYYAMDPFHEGGNSEGVDLDLAGKTLMGAMKRANSKAVWVVQGWQQNPKNAMISNLETGDLLVLDLYSEKMPKWSKGDGYGKHDWLYCMLLNFGGRVGLHGRMDQVINGYYDAREHSKGATLRGIGATPEAIENNPVMFELLYELPWIESRFGYKEWLEKYLTARYGKADNNIAQCWDLLCQTVYNTPQNYPGEGTVESLLCARPGINLKSASTWGSALLYYDPDMTRRAAECMLNAASAFGGNNNFEYDLVDILRQAIADRANVVSREFSSAYINKDPDKFASSANEFMTLLECQDKLLGTRREFRVGAWTDKACRLSTDPILQGKYQWNAKTLITVWGPRYSADSGGLHDYSNREWQGIMSDLYARRWQLFFEAKTAELKGETPQPIDWFALEEQWTRSNKRYDPEPEREVIETAREVFHSLFNNK